MNQELNLIWLNGKFLSKEQEILENSSLTSIYQEPHLECIAVYNGKIFKAEEHLQRFFNTLETSLVENYFTINQIIDISQELIKLNNLKDGYIYLSFSIKTSSCKESSRAISIRIACQHRSCPYPINLLDKEDYNLKISSTTKPAFTKLSYASQSIGLYTINHVAKKRAISSGYHDALILDQDNFLTEISDANFFMIKNNIIHTPTTESCLNGITRKIIIDIAKQNNIQLIERNIHVDELAEADSAFLSGTSIEITSVSSIEKRQYKHNPITQTLYSKFYQITQDRLTIY
jgi:branched-subunit amino acid aminotransferase/4-amino-4-deoxychorismate lyase